MFYLNDGYNQSIGRMMAHDAYSSAAPSLSGYRAFLNNPVSVTDPTGNYEISDGYSDISGSGALAVEYWGPSITERSLNNDEYIYKPDDWVEDKNGNIYWDQNATSQSTTKKGEKYLGKAVVVMDGRGGEQLGPNQKISEKGAKPAVTTVYGPGGPNDVQTYDGLTITSDPNTYNQIASGDYEGFHQQMNTSIYGKGSLTYRIRQLNGNLSIPTQGGKLNVNPNSPAHGTPFMTEIFFHRTNNSGFAGTRKGGVAVSKGCPVVCGTQWKGVERQLGKISSFRLRIIR